MKFIIVIFNLALIGIVPLAADTWPQWRGPLDNLTAMPGAYPIRFDAERDPRWTVTLPGKGSSTPVVYNERIIVTCGIGDDDTGLDGVLCYDLNGQELWRTTLGKQRKGRHRRGSGSCPSPVTDGKLIIVYYKSGTLAALDFEGRIIWRKNLQKTYGEDKLWWDLGTSPVLVDDKVVVAVMHEENSYVVALDKRSGAEIWKTARNFVCAEESHQSYTTPHVYRDGKSTTLILFGADHLTGHDATSGEMQWQCGGFNPENKKN